MIESASKQPTGATLQDQLCFELYAASRAMTSHYRPGLDSHGLTYPQYLVMLVLWEHASVSVGELSQRLQLSTGTISPLLHRLENTGLLTRQRRTDDERVVQLTITPTGMDLLEHTVVQRTRMTNTTAMSDAARQELIDVLTNLTTRLRAGGSTPQRPAQGDHPDQ